VLVRVSRPRSTRQFSGLFFAPAGHRLNVFLRRRASVPFGFVLARVRFLPSTHYPLYDFDLRATHARTLLPAALASASFRFVLVRVRVR